jgi:uncharacterized protein (TIGR03067 family)
MNNRLLTLAIVMTVFGFGEVWSSVASAQDPLRPVTPPAANPPESSQQTVTSLTPVAPVPATPRNEASIWKELAGTWKPTSGLIAGKPMPEGIKNNRLTIRANKTYEFDFGSIKDKGKLVVDLSDEVMRMEFLGTEGPSQDSSIPTIFKFDDGQLVVCYRLGSEEKITEFESPENTETFLIRYERLER